MGWRGEEDFCSEDRSPGVTRCSITDQRNLGFSRKSRRQLGRGRSARPGEQQEPEGGALRTLTPVENTKRCLLPFKDK